jgi:hypothetical protein
MSHFLKWISAFYERHEFVKTFFIDRVETKNVQNVMFIELNIINNIYELTRQAQLKENHYKRIDDAKSRRRSSAVVTIEIETRVAINRTMSIVTISISINEKIEQTFVEMTIWNFNQFWISTSRVIFKTFNLDSTKEKLMKADKCFNCDESSHFDRDCSKLKKFQNDWDEREKWYKEVEKRIIFVKNVTKTKDLIISSFVMKNDLFDETFVLINCVLKDKIRIIKMINIDVIEYAFIDESIAQSLCETLKIEWIQLIKKRLVRVYDKRKN